MEKSLKLMCIFVLGCTLCECSYTSDCPEHGPVTFIPDAPIQSRARLSLPRPLCLRISVADEPLGKKRNLIINEDRPQMLL